MEGWQGWRYRKQIDYLARLMEGADRRRIMAVIISITRKPC